MSHLEKLKLFPKEEYKTKYKQFINLCLTFNVWTNKDGNFQRKTNDIKELEIITMMYSYKNVLN